MSILKIIILAILIIIIVYVVIQTIRCTIAVKNAKKRLESYEAKNITLSYGNMSYVDKGNGEVILSIHGISGGYDQGFDQAYSTFKDLDSYRIISPSRFGYLESDILGDGTPFEQAKAYQELLDKLGIEKVYVLASSAGGSSAIRFALDYPERIKGLILYSAGMPPLKKPTKVPKYSGPPAFACNDYIMYMISPFFKLLMGMDSSIIDSMLPMEERKEGIVLDASVTNGDLARNFDKYHIEDLKNPTLILQAKDDKLVKYKEAKEGVKRFPNATVIVFEDGGHLLEGHSKEVHDAVNEFIKATK